MKCVICHGDEIEATEVKEEFAVGDDVIYVPITASVCRTCGERYYDRRTMRFLEDIRRKLPGDEKRLREIGRVLMYG
jgi:YgiT-type zinc finger domain-containing protein